MNFGINRWVLGLITLLLVMATACSSDAAFSAPAEDNQAITPEVVDEVSDIVEMLESDAIPVLPFYDAYNGDEGFDIVVRTLMAFMSGDGELATVQTNAGPTELVLPDGSISQDYGVAIIRFEGGDCGVLYLIEASVDGQQTTATVDYWLYQEGGEEPMITIESGQRFDIINYTTIEDTDVVRSETAGERLQFSPENWLATATEDGTCPSEFHQS